MLWRFYILFYWSERWFSCDRTCLFLLSGSLYSWCKLNLVWAAVLMALGSQQTRSDVTLTVVMKPFQPHASSLIPLNCKLFLLRHNFNASVAKNNHFRRGGGIKKKGLMMPKKPHRRMVQPSWKSNWMEWGWWFIEWKAKYLTHTLMTHRLFPVFYLVLRKKKDKGRH